MFQDTSSWQGHSWHSPHAQCQKKAMSAFREEMASKAKRAINWEVTRTFSDGIYLEWNSKASLKNALLGVELSRWPKQCS